ncbi:MAG: TonB-dependent receptor plug domain-containing protein, partial [Bacteroidota bacterium]
INSIEVTKGVGPVTNGYESIAGQINVELKKPQESEKLYLNGYVNQSGRSEANVNYTVIPMKKWATTFLLHGSSRPFEMDSNHDSFLDFPVGSQLNAINRWVYNSGDGWLGQFGVKVLKDNKQGGQEGFDREQDQFTTNRYGFEINTDRLELLGKLGYQFASKPYKSIALQLSAHRHDHDSYYGFVVHDASEKSGYANLIYQSMIGSTAHKFKTGVSFMYSDYDERLLNGRNLIKTVDKNGEFLSSVANYDRIEQVPGAFFEYTYAHLDKVSIIAGVRADQHNLFGTIFTPRVYAKLSLTETSTLRLSAGKGTRVANVLIENAGVLASARQFIFSNLQTAKAYGFKPDVAWNYGLNFLQDFTLDYRAGTITFDYFYTNFKNQAVLDFDRSAREANFFGLQGKSYSHSLQFQIDYQLMRRFDLRMAYRWLDVQTDYLNARLTRPLISKHRAFINLAYETKNKWKFDYTVQWLGKQRIPDTSLNPGEYQLATYSPAYMLMNAQIAKDFKDQWSVYLGVENINNYQLDSPIVAAYQPFSVYFDASMVWGPIFGRMVYLGFRYRLK